MENDDYLRIAQAIHYLEEHRREQPSLDEVAKHIGLSPFHFQRLFRRWAGVSPKRFLQFLTAEHAKRLLRQSASVLDASLEAGLSGPGRLHDLLISVEAVTPGEFKERGHGVEIRYGLHDSPFGKCLIGLTERGICHLAFVDQASIESALEELCNAWAEGHIVEDVEATSDIVKQIFERQDQANAQTIPLLLRGTNFQLKVWQALLKIPEGRLISYYHLAEKIGHPSASRAIGNAIGRNPIAYLIPCHRVLRSNGELGGYRWGTDRKQAILGWELAIVEGEE